MSLDIRYSIRYLLSLSLTNNTERAQRTYTCGHDGGARPTRHTPQRLRLPSALYFRLPSWLALRRAGYLLSC